MARWLAEFRGNYYTVKDARIFTLPDQLPPIIIAASKPQAAALAGRIGDGLISMVPEKQTHPKIRSCGRRRQAALRSANGVLRAIRRGRRRNGSRAMAEWRHGRPTNGGSANSAHFEAVAEVMAPEAMTKDIILGPSLEKHIEGVRQYIDAGFDHVYVHQTGPGQSAFIDFYTKKVLPALAQ